MITDEGRRDVIPVALMEAMVMISPPLTTTVAGIQSWSITGGTVYS